MPKLLPLNGTVADRTFSDLFNDAPPVPQDAAVESLEPSDGEEAIRKAAERPTPVTRMGDLWLLGRHRLLCGDSRIREDVRRVVEREVDMVWTDPPYGVEYVGKTEDALTIENDKHTEQSLIDFLDTAFHLAWHACKPGACWYVTAPAGPLHWCFAEVLRRLAVHRQTLVWLKHVFVMGRSDYHYRHEPMFYGWKPGASHYFNGGRDQDSIWEIDRPMRSREHPTMKPIELVARAIRNSSRPGDTVLDPFCGSGTTIIAAEKEGRCARAIEIDPFYCDVTLTRWADFTGGDPVREDGARWSELKAATPPAVGLNGVVHDPFDS